MKRRLILIIVICLSFSLFAAGGRNKLRTGVFLSLGHTNYSFKNFSDPDYAVAFTIDPADLFLGFSLIYRNFLELNLVYNRSTEGAAPNTSAYDKDGLGLELGGLLAVPLFSKSSFDVSLEFVGGGYTMLYLYKQQTRSFPDLGIDKESANLYQLGFYWAVRVRYLIAGKASFEVGYKALLPVKSNEFLFRTGKEGLLYKSFFTLGVSF